MERPHADTIREWASWIRRAVRGPARTLDEVRETVYLDTGDAPARIGRFTMLLVLSAIVATAGVLVDSTATVIGAMIIAPLATPIQGIAIAIVAGEPRRLWFSLGALTAGSAVTVLIGVGLGRALPDLIPLVDNSQVTGRTSPNTIDLYAAAATGLAGSLGIARKDVSDILPGVAIAISLVPPLAVVGVTASEGDWSGSFGALLLFVTNVLAIVVMCALLFTALGYQRQAVAEPGFRRSRAYAAVGVASLVVVLALGALTYRSTQINGWTSAASAVAKDWADDSGDRVVDVHFDGGDLVVVVEGLGSRGETDDLLKALSGRIPSGTAVIVDRQLGVRRDVGDVP